MSGAIALVGGAALGYIIILLRRLLKMASNAADVLREVGETTASNTALLTSNGEVTSKVLELLQKATPTGDGSLTLTQEQADTITSSLQTVQDNNAAAIETNNQTVAAINAVLTPAPAEG